MKTTEEINSLIKSRDYYRAMYEKEKRCSRWLDALADHLRDYANRDYVENQEEEESSQKNVDELYDIYLEYDLRIKKELK